MINNKKAVVLLIEPVSSIRSMMGQVLKSFDIKNIISVGTVKEAIRSLEAGDVDWLIAPPLLHEEYNVVHFLKLILKEPSLRKIKVTLMLEAETEMTLMPMVFQLGLMSWVNHKTIFNDLKQEFDEMAQICKANNDDFVLISAAYIRKYSFQSKQYKNLIAYERNLLHYYPGLMPLLLNLAHTLILSGKQEKAKPLLRQALLVDQTLKNQVAKLCERYQIDFSSEKDDEIAENPFNLKSVLIIDPDSDIQSSLTEILESVGVKKIQCFTKADEAFSFMETMPEPSLIICEWDVPGVLGAILIQRIRNLRWFQVPILVASYKVKTSDGELLREFGVDFVLTKPFSKEGFLRKLAFLLQENRKPSEQGSYESRIIRLSQRGRVVESEKLLSDAKKNIGLSSDTSTKLSAFIDFGKKDYKQCASRCRQFLKSHPTDTLTLHLLGKAHLMLHSYQDALACFDKAAEKSPDNIERLVLMSDVEEKLNNDEESEKHLEKAEALDQKSILVKVAKCKKLLKSGNKKLSKELAKDLDNYTMLVSSINNYAISLVHSKKFGKAIELYQKAIDILPEEELTNKKILIYNLTLALVRNAETESAAPLLKGLADLKSKEKIDRKIRSLNAKISAAVKKGENLIIPLDAEITEQEQEELADLLLSVLPSHAAISSFFDVAGLGDKFEVSEENEIAHFKPVLSQLTPQELADLKLSS